MQNSAYLGRGLEFNFPLAGPVLFYPLLEGEVGMRTERREGENVRRLRKKQRKRWKESLRGAIKRSTCISLGERSGYGING